MFASNPVYNAASQTESLTIGSPTVGSRLTETYTYDSKTGLLTDQQVTRVSDSAVFLDLKYNYTLNNDAQNNGAKTGQLTGVTDQQNQARNRAYEYDKLGRLKKVKGGVNAFYSPQWAQIYSYDRYGNRSSVVSDPLLPPLPSNIPLDGLASLSFNTASNRATSANFEYDPAGNQTKAVINSSGAAQKYRYDAAGRLAQALDANDNVQATYSYGASNQRLMSVEGAVTTYYGWDGGRVIAEYTPSGASGLSWQTGYVYLGGRLLATMNGAAGSGTRFHHPDRLGTNVVTDQSNGELVTKQMGMPFGTQQPMGAFGGDNSWQHPSKSNPSKKRFTSYDRSDATGLDYAVNRFYSAAQGRFTQVDPIGMSAASLSDPQSLNMYSYCGNDPINHVDPDGLFFKKLFGWVGKAFKFLFKVAAVALFVVAMVLLPGAIAGFVAWKGWFILMGLAGAAGLAGWHNGKLGTIAGTLLTAGLGWKGNARTPNTFPKGIGVGGVSNFIQDRKPAEIKAGPPENSSWLKLFWEFLTGTGPYERQFNADSDMTKGLRTSPDVAAHREKFCEGFKTRKAMEYRGDAVSFGFKAMDGPVTAGFNMPRQFVGSFSIKITGDPSNGSALFEVTNITSRESFLYHLPVGNTKRGPMSDSKQIFWWREESPCYPVMRAAP